MLKWIGYKIHLVIRSKPLLFFETCMCIWCVWCVRHMCMCSCVWVQVHLCQGAYVQVRGQPWVSVLGTHLVWGRVSLLFTTAQSGVAGPQLSRESPLSTFHLKVGTHGLQPPATPSLHVGSGHLNSGPHSCTVIALPTEPSPLPAYFIS